jgi:diguanylate cyclase (GGDEF)-like protein/PAS domain S-box-containing protein
MAFGGWRGRRHPQAKRPDRFDREIAAAQTARLFQQVRGNFVANLVETAALLWVFWSHLPHHDLWLWAAYAQAVNAGGVALVLARRFRHDRLTDAGWIRVFQVYAIADAGTWALAIWVFFLPDSPLLTLFMTAIVLGNAAGGTTSFVSVLRVMAPFNVVVLLPLALRFALAGGEVYWTLTALALVYSCILMNLGVGFHRHIRENLRLRFELEESEHALRESRDLLEHRVLERTEQLQQANDELTKSEAMYRAVVEVQTELVCRFVPGGRLTFVNEAFCRFFDVDRSRVVGHDFITVHRDLELMPEDEAAAVLACVANLSPSSPTGTCETRVPGRDGSDRWLMWTHRALFDGAGRVIEYQSVAIDISERKTAERQIEFIAHHDALTGLPNRLFFKRRLLDSLAQSDRSKRRTALLLLDLDDFKHVNDALGHLHGDKLLIEVSRRLRRCIRGDDLVVRLGGDEFAIVQSEISSVEEASALAERILTQLNRPATVDEHTIRICSSLGISVYPEDAADPDALLKNADLALYRAKGRGRATYEFFSQELARQASRRMEIISGLRDAIDLDQFHLVYQPKIRLNDGKVIGCEALLRWSHPQEGPISPGEFVPVAETAGLSLPIGDWVLGEVCRQISEWRAGGLSIMPVSVNLSATQFSDRRMNEKVREALSAHSIDPALVEFEITETALMRDVDLAVDVANGLLEMGVRLSIDDFGTGYSSFGYLRRLPVADIKVDRAFVKDIARSESDNAILRAMVDLGHSLGLGVLAEGVETQAQLDTLTAIGCDYAQGYFIAKPLTADALMGFKPPRVRAGDLVVAAE